MAEGLVREAMKAYNFIANEGWPRDKGVEPRDTAGAIGGPSASESGQDDSERKAERLLEAIVSRENLNLAYKRVKANGGSHGVDGMTIDRTELQKRSEPDFRLMSDRLLGLMGTG